MGFEFRPAFVPVEIEGKEYQIKIGDLGAIEEMQSVVKEITKIANDTSVPSDERFISVCKRMRDVIASMIGKEACDEIFADREDNIVETVQLLTYLKEVSADAQKNNSIDKLLEEFGLNA